jgi:hypothetical protein
VSRRRRRARRRALHLLLLFAGVATGSFTWGFLLGSDNWPEPEWRDLVDSGGMG